MTESITIHSEGWTAEVLHGDLIGGYRSVLCKTVGDSNALALEAAQQVLQIFAAGRAAIIRAKPVVYSETEFDTKKASRVGYVRFHYSVQPGEWRDAEHELNSRNFLGFA